MFGASSELASVMEFDFNRNFTEVFAVRKLESLLATIRCRLTDDGFSRFDTIYECDRRTDGHVMTTWTATYRWRCGAQTSRACRVRPRRRASVNWAPVCAVSSTPGRRLTPSSGRPTRPAPTSPPWRRPPPTGTSSGYERQRRGRVSRPVHTAATELN